jgi:hypothetical protein
MRRVVTSVPAYMWTKSLPHAIYPVSPRCVIIVRVVGAGKEKKRETNVSPAHSNDQHEQ